MHTRDVSIILVRPDDTDYPLVDLAVHDSALETVARRFFSELEISDCRFVEPALPNQDYCRFWSGSKDGFEYELRRAEAHASEYPFWIWVGMIDSGGWSDRLSEQAHSIAERLRQSGWRCLVRGYVSATSIDAV